MAPGPGAMAPGPWPRFDHNFHPDAPLVPDHRGIFSLCFPVYNKPDVVGVGSIVLVVVAMVPSIFSFRKLVNKRPFKSFDLAHGSFLFVSPGGPFHCCEFL